MNYKQFIDGLNDEDRENYMFFSKIRGEQSYRIIFDALLKENIEFSYYELNSFIRCDKALKDVLYSYLAVIEEMIRTYLFCHYEIDTSKLKESQINKGEIRSESTISNIIFKQEIKYGEISELYKYYALEFGSLIKLLKLIDDKEYDLNKLDQIRILRNNVMHHYPLFFDKKGNSNANELKNQIEMLIELLPIRYKEKNEKYMDVWFYINEPLRKARERTNGKYNNILIEIGGKKCVDM